MEKVKWDNMRQAVGKYYECLIEIIHYSLLHSVYLGMFALLLVFGMEVSGLASRPKSVRAPPSSVPVLAASHPGDTSSLEGNDWVT